METPINVRPASLALTESQNIRQCDQVCPGMQSAKGIMGSSSSAAASSAEASPAAAAAGPSCSPAPAAAAGPAAEGEPPRQGPHEAGGGGERAVPPATPAVVPATTEAAGATAVTPFLAAPAATAVLATPAVPTAFATPAAPGRAAAAAVETPGGGGRKAVAVATDRMMLATPSVASVTTSAPDSAPVATSTDWSSSMPAPSTEDQEAESLALARRLVEEEAMASYAAAVDIFRSSAAAAGAAEGSGIEGMAAEDMAAMQALLEEDENSPDAFAMAEDESLDYDGMLELGSAIGDVRRDRWRMRCKSVIAALPRLSYAAGGSDMGGIDTKCLVCQCEYEAGEDLRVLPCSHPFHTVCVDGWLEHNEECPTCRQSVSPQSVA